MSCQSTLAHKHWSLAYLLLLFLLPASIFAKTTLLFTGDILLSREVEREIALKNGQSPWTNLQSYLRNADWVMANFEGSVGDSSQCTKKDLCFAVKPTTLNYLSKAGFTAVSIENNHVADLGKKGRISTRHWLKKNKIAALDFEHSPGFFKINNHILGVVAFTQIKGKDDVAISIPSETLRQKIQLAKSLSDWVIVTVHWGSELSDWPNDKQQEMAAWLVQQGADVIIGHHPHVVQAPECIQNHPVFFSLGNHVFDQKYPESKKGLIARCDIEAEKLICSGVRTKTPHNSSFPELVSEKDDKKQDIERCTVIKGQPLKINGYVIRPKVAERQLIDGDIVLEGIKDAEKKWTIKARHLLSLAKAQFIKDKFFLFSLENHLSDMDDAISPRPYVYDVGPQGLVAKWRGSALAWPLVDAVLITKKETKIDYLCALHRKDAYITLNPSTKETRTAVYQWNGFGFSGIEDANLTKQCQHFFN